MTAAIVDRGGQIGPHEGRELQLMQNGTKPLSVFSDEGVSGSVLFLKAAFELEVSGGRFVKSCFTDLCVTDLGSVTIQTTLYALSDHAWRMPAYRFVTALYAKQPGWRPDLERVIGALLGYSDEDVEAFIAKVTA